MNLPEFLTQDPDGHIHVTGHRIGLQDLVYYYNEGYSPEALLDAFSTLSLANIHKVIAFYLENRAEWTPTGRGVTWSWSGSEQPRRADRIHRTSPPACSQTGRGHLTMALRFVLDTPAMSFG